MTLRINYLQCLNLTRHRSLTSFLSGYQTTKQTMKKRSTWANSGQESYAPEGSDYNNILTDGPVFHYKTNLKAQKSPEAVVFA